MPFFVHRVVGAETQLQRVRSTSLLIGRGTGAQLRFPDDAAVDLEHAVIREDEKGYLLVDQGSLTGTYLNGQAIVKARLSDEDRIGIGGYQIRVQITHREDPLFLHVRPVGTPEPAAPEPAAPEPAAPEPAPPEQPAPDTAATVRLTVPPELTAPAGSTPGIAGPKEEREEAPAPGTSTRELDLPPAEGAVAPEEEAPAAPPPGDPSRPTAEPGPSPPPPEVAPPLRPPAPPATGPEAPRFDYATAYGLERRWAGKGLLAACGLVAAAAAALYAFAGPTAATRPGPVSEAHAAVGLATACGACHAPWRGVADARCESCHAGPRHQPAQAFDPSCDGCHLEHRDRPRLARVPDARCLACHRELALAGGAEPRVARRITGFSDHPELRLPADANPLRLDHALHLEPGLRGPDGREQLACRDCHRFDRERGEILPVSFEEHCQRCHDLYFDDRFPTVQAPHGDPEEVRRGILGAYAGGGDALASLSDEEVRRLIFSGRGGGISMEQRLQRQAFTAADRVFRHRCTLCHAMEIRSLAEVRVEPPRGPQRWLDAARFSHRPHRVMECADCHAGALESHDTADVLIPGITACTGCHGGAAGGAPEDRVPTGCVTCHLYHEKSALGWEPARAPLPAREGARR